MCQRVKCHVCNKPTYAGCGAHIEQVLGNVPRAERCQGHAADATQPGGAQSRRKMWPFG